jgi:S1-C subfamily serine protease
MGPVLPVILALLLSLQPGLTASAQEGSVLKVSVVLTDADGNAIPIPRAQLLISDNPATREPRRVRTGADGTAEIALPAGSYTVESDVPVSFGGRRFSWTQTLDVPAGRSAVLALTAANAETEIDTGSGVATGNTAPTLADGEAILNKWHRSIAEIWAPTAHATGFVIDARGLIATYDRTIGDATDVEVEFGGPAAGAADRVKVAGRVLASDRTQGVTIIWIHPEAIASRPPIVPTCPGLGADSSAVALAKAEALAKAAVAQPLVTHDQKVVALIAPMLEPKSALLGSASRPDAQSFRTDWHLDAGTAGGPVFAADGTAIGITVGEVEEDRKRRDDDYVIPLSNACRVIEAAAQKMSGATPPSATLLRTEAGLPRDKTARLIDKKTPRVQPPVITADEFDISLVSPAMIGGDHTTSSSRTFFGYWTPYVSNAPQVMLLRVSPQFEESFWKMLARGAAQTQGVALPPLRSFSANFLRLRAFCGGTEVEPIHRFIVEMPIEGRKPVREGLYVFALTDFGPHCTSVRVELFSEKSPNRPDSRTIDPKLFTVIAGQSR